jgi:hypothetical protein
MRVETNLTKEGSVFGGGVTANQLEDEGTSRVDKSDDGKGQGKPVDPGILLVGEDGQ